jgi:hypothetical protein
VKMPFWGLHPLLCLFFQCFSRLGEEVKTKLFGLLATVYARRIAPFPRSFGFFHAQ